jgi:Flp pilus assembly protein TadD
MKGQLTEALNALNKAISLDPKNTDNYIKRGLVHMQLGKTDEAIADMDQVLAADPSNAQAKDLRHKFMEHRPK